jgi:N-methylhydantoinase B
MREQRGEIEMFDFGGTIEEIKARCVAETHLEPPQAPTFAQG